jgi:hypothetical protein
MSFCPKKVVVIFLMLHFAFKIRYAVGIWKWIK